MTKMTNSLTTHLDSIPANGVALDALAKLANLVLEQQGLLIDDGRTADRVDGRTIRFYQTIGILPKPIYEGRRAFYNREHLVRVVAAKQLQSEGYSLAQVQATLPARTTDELFRAVAAIPAERTTSPKGAATSLVAPPHMTGELRAFILAEGITLVIDPARVKHASDVAAALAAVIARSLAQRDPQTSLSPTVTTSNNTINKGTTR